MAYGSVKWSNYVYSYVQRIQGVTPFCELYPGTGSQAPSVDSALE